MPDPKSGDAKGDDVPQAPEPITSHDIDIPEPEQPDPDLVQPITSHDVDPIPEDQRGGTQPPEEPKRARERDDDESKGKNKE